MHGLQNILTDALCFTLTGIKASVAGELHTRPPRPTHADMPATLGHAMRRLEDVSLSRATDRICPIADVDAATARHRLRQMAVPIVEMTMCLPGIHIYGTV